MRLIREDIFHDLTTTSVVFSALNFIRKITHEPLHDFFTLTGSKSNVKYEINVRDEVSSGDVKAVPHSVDFGGPVELRHGKPVSVVTEVERNL